jgi:hypothetical protein
VRRRRDGLHCFYAVSDPAVFVLCGQVCETLRRNADARVAALREPA